MGDIVDIPTELRRGVGNCDPQDIREAEELMDRAAAEIEKLRYAVDIARTALLRVERLSEESRAAITQEIAATVNIHHSGEKSNG